MRKFPKEALVFQQQSRFSNQEISSRTLEQTRDDVFVQIHLMNTLR